MKFLKFLNESKKVKKLIVISSNFENKSNNKKRTSEKFIIEGEKMGLLTQRIYTDGVWLTKNKGGFFIHNNDDEKGFKISKDDTIIINREATVSNSKINSIITDLEKEGFFIVNNSESIAECENKYKTYTKLSENNILTPKTRIIRNVESVEKILAEFKNKFPMVIKTTTGTHGIGVFLVRNKEDLIAILQTMWKLNNEIEIICQQYLDSKYDYRIHVLNNEIICCMKRIRTSKDFRSNYSLGNRTENVNINDIPEEMKKIAIKSAKIMNTFWCGVDIINENNNYYVLEVNTSPGTEGIEKASKLNVVSMVLKSCIDKSNWNIVKNVLGYIEYIEIENIGKVKAKLDTGNGACVTLHADTIYVKNGIIHWSFNNKTYKNKLIKYIKVNTGTSIEKRPVILLNIKFNNKSFKNIEVCLDNRKSKSTEVLLSRDFLIMADVIVNPDKRYMLNFDTE